MKTYRFASARPSWRRKGVAVAVLVAVSLACSTALVAAAPSGQVTLFTAGLSGPTVLGNEGADGNMWFLEAQKVGKITPAGVTTEYSAGLNPGSAPYRMGAVGSDGNMWFSDRGSTKAIGRITPDGTITEFSAGLPPGSNPGRLQPGPDGNMWFVDQGATKALGVISPTGQITEITAGLNPGSNPNSVAAGPDGNVWFTDLGTTRALGVINPTTHAIQEFASGLNPGSVPQIVAAGSDGGMWFSDNGNPNAAGRIDPVTHLIQEFSAGLTPGGAPNGITLGADGNIWLVEPLASKLARVTPSGTITEYPTGTRPTADATGADGNLWFGAFSTAAVGQMGTDAPVASVTPPAIGGTGLFGIPQSCGGDQWSSWAGEQPSHTTESWNGYQWLRDGGPITGATGSAYTPAAADVGHQLTCSVTVTYALLGVTVSATSAPVTGSFAATITGTRSGPLRVASGESVQLAPGASVHGPLTVEPGGALDVDGAAVDGPLRAHGAAAIRICGANVTGPLDIDGATGPVTVGDGTAACPSTHLSGPVGLTNNSGDLQIIDAVVDGPLTVIGNTGTVVDTPNSVHGPSRLQ
jgi:streptogramin lyase